MMNSLTDQFHALVIGASGTIGAAFVDLLEHSPRCASVRGLHRHSAPAIDFADEASVAAAAAAGSGAGAVGALSLHAASVVNAKADAAMRLAKRMEISLGSGA